MEKFPLRILIVQTAFLGDVVLATPLIEKLHQHFPEAKIDFMLRKGNEQLLQGHPKINRLLVWEKRQRKLANLWQLLKQVRASRYNLVINLQRFAASGLLTLFSGATQTIGFNKNPFSLFFSRRFPHEIGDGKHEISRNLSLVQALTDAEVQRPVLYPSASDYQQVASFAQKPYICIAPTSVWFTKQYPAERWLELLDAIPDSYAVYLLGAPSDREACEYLATTTTHTATTNLAGTLTLLQSAALMEKALLNYVNDSAPLHLASSVDAPVCAIFCSTVPKFGFGPLSSFSYVVEAEEALACRPCGLHGYQECPKKHFACAHTISHTKLLYVLRQAELHR